MKELYTALAKAQGMFARIPRNKTVTVRTKTGGTYTFSYAPLETIRDAVIPALTANGIALGQDIKKADTDYVVTVLRHASGEFLETSPVPILGDTVGPQAFGSALTYARRYSLCLALGLCADDDDDANAAEGNEVTAKLKESSKKVLGGAIPEVADVEPLTAQAMADEIAMVMEKDGSGQYLYPPSDALKVHERFNPHQMEYIAASTLVSSTLRNAFKARVNEARKNGTV